MTYELHDRAGHVLHVSAPRMPDLEFIEAHQLSLRMDGKPIVTCIDEVYQRYLRDWPKWDPRD